MERAFCLRRAGFGGGFTFFMPCRQWIDGLVGERWKLGGIGVLFSCRRRWVGSFVRDTWHKVGGVTLRSDKQTVQWTFAASSLLQQDSCAVHFQELTEDISFYKERCYIKPYDLCSIGHEFT